MDAEGAQLQGTSPFISLKSLQCWTFCLQICTYLLKSKRLWAAHEICSWRALGLTLCKPQLRAAFALCPGMAGHMGKLRVPSLPCASYICTTVLCRYVGWGITLGISVNREKVARNWPSVHSNETWPCVTRGELRGTPGLQTCVCAHLLLVQGSSCGILPETLGFNLCSLNLLDQNSLKCAVPGTCGQMMFKPLHNHPQGKPAPISSVSLLSANKGTVKLCWT